MASTYKIFLPNGTSCLFPYGEYGEKLNSVKAALEGWGLYLDGNWISTNHTDVFCGENKVKRFLDGLAYYLLIGSEDVVTDYKELMNGKREIPMSSCPSQINDIVYGAGAALHPQGDDELMIHDFTDNEIPHKKKKPKKQEGSQRSDNLKTLREEFGQNAKFAYCRVDTANVFEFGGKGWQISEDVEAYQPKHTPLGDLYDMDTIIVIHLGDFILGFCDSDYRRIGKEKIKNIF